MKKFFLIFLLTLTCNYAFSQFDDILKKATEKVAKVDLLEEKNVTTSIDDALPVAYWLSDLNTYNTPSDPSNYSFDLEPGYYKYLVQSYCLKAGTVGPSKGDGYLLAPLKGKRADLVYNIVTRSVNHPEIKQHDIQVLLWGIIYGTKFTDYSVDFQNKVKPLLTVEDIADLSLDLKNVPLEVMPDDIRKVAQFYHDFRQRLVNPNLTYRDVEQMAMLPNVLPDDPFSKYIRKGQWAYIGNGFYGRSMPISYPQTVFEVYRPPVYNIIRDDKKRITSIEYNNDKVEFVYNDDAGQDVINFGSNGVYPIYRFKNIKFTSKTGAEINIENSGWMVKDDGEKLKNNGQSLTGEINDNDPPFSEYKNRSNNTKNKLTDFDEYQKNKKNNPDKNKRNEHRNNMNTSDGGKDAMDKSNSDPGIIQKFKNFFNNFCNFSSSDNSGEGSENNNSKKADISKTPAVPATNGKQRILSSSRAFSDD